MTTTPSKAAQKERQRRVEAETERGSYMPHEDAFARYIDEVSEIVGDYVRHCCTSDHKRETALRTLILPDEPDPRLEPLAEALSGIVPSICAREGESAAGAVARMLLEELDKSGSLKIVEAGDD